MAVKQERRFRLGTTSFIVPDHIIPNVKILGPYFDEIELLVFESRPKEVLPSSQDIDILTELSKQFDLTYNVHLPVDISLSKGSSAEREKAADLLLTILERFEPLKASTHTLHLDMPEENNVGKTDEKPAKQWVDQLEGHLDLFLSRLKNIHSISIETLDYDFSLIETQIRSRNLPICIDIGHGIKYNYDWYKIYRTAPEMVPLVHLHGVENMGEYLKDHQGLDTMGVSELSNVISFLQMFTGTVSLEVYNYYNLKSSLECLSAYFNDIPNIDSINY